jgi:hypothetical protein
LAEVEVVKVDIMFTVLISVVEIQHYIYNQVPETPNIREKRSKKWELAMLDYIFENTFDTASVAECT